MVWPASRTRVAIFIAYLTAGLTAGAIGFHPLPLVGAVIAAIVGLDTLMRLSRPRRTLLWVLRLFAVLAIPLAWHAPDNDYGREKVTLLFTSTLLSALAVLLFRHRKDLERFLAWWPLVGAAISLLILVGPTQQTRSVALDANPIWLARPVSSAFVALAWGVMYGRITRQRALPLALLMFAGVIATGSRGPFLAMLVGAILLVAARHRRGRTRRRILTASIAVAAITVLLLAPPSDDTRIGGLLADPNAAFVDSTRGDLFGPTLTVIADHPMGVGYGNWQDEVSAGASIYPHNLWLEVLAEAGWLVGVVLIGTALVVLRRLWVRAPQQPVAHALLGLLVVECVNVSVSGDVNSRSFFAVLALGALTVRQRRHHESRDPAVGAATTPQSMTITRS